MAGADADTDAVTDAGPGAATSRLPRSGGGLRNFTVLWLGQVVSLIGSGLTAFAIGVWVYQTTGSATRFTLIATCAALPVTLLSPIAGAIADRWSRRWVMLISDLGAATTSVTLIVLLRLDALELWHIYVLVAIAAAFNTVQFPAFSAATTLLVPKTFFGRASGMRQFGISGAQILAPLLGGALLGLIGLGGVILVDLGTFLFAAATLLVVRIPEPPARHPGKVRPTLWRDALYGWTYIRERPALIHLLGYFAVLNLVLPFCLILTTPLVLAFSDAENLGLVLGIASSGALAGGILTSVWEGPRRRILGVLAPGGLVAAGLVLAAWQPRVATIAAGLLLVYFAMPVINAASQAIWQVKVEPAVQGRVFAMRRAIAQATGPIAYLAAGPVADKVFRPLLAEAGLLAPTVGRVLGVGPGRGIALLFVVIAGVMVAVTAWGFANPSLRGLEDDLPDAVE